MKFITISNTHYNLNTIACFWWIEGYIFIQCVGDDMDAVGRHEDPHRAYYKKLCDATGVIPTEVSE